MSVRVPTANPMIAALIDAQAFHDRQHTALGRAIDALRAVDEPIRDASPQRSAKGSSRLRADGRPRRTFSAAAKRRMSAGMRRFWKRRKAAAAVRAAKLAKAKKRHGAIIREAMGTGK